MPLSDATRTPATTRKRARCQAPAAASLSLLAVPKLKASELPLAVKLDTETSAVAGASVPQSESSISLTKAAHIHERQDSSAVPPVTCQGKENQPAGVSCCVGLDTKLSRTQRAVTPNVFKTKSRPELQAKHKCKATITATKDIAPPGGLLQTAPSSPIASNLVRHSKIGSEAAMQPSVVAADSTDSQRAGSLSDHRLGKHRSVPSAMPVDFNAEDEYEQELLHEAGMPLACVTAINKRRCCCPIMHTTCSVNTLDAAYKALASQDIWQIWCAHAQSPQLTCVMQASCRKSNAIWRVVHWQ